MSTLRANLAGAAAGSSKSAQTRRRILSTAAAAFRRHGFDGIGLREIMKLSGLSPGGFYFHFRDKDALFREASREGLQSSSAWLREGITQAPPGKELRGFIERYLSPMHRDHPDTGCMVAGLAADVARRDKQARLEFSRALGERLDKLTPLLRGPQGERFQQAGVLLASMSGVLTVSRLLVGTPQSDELLAAAREFFIAQYCS